MPPALELALGLEDMPAQLDEVAERGLRVQLIELTQQLIRVNVESHFGFLVAMRMARRSLRPFWSSFVRS